MSQEAESCNIIDVLTDEASDTASSTGIVSDETYGSEFDNLGIALQAAHNSKNEIENQRDQLKLPDTVTVLDGNIGGKVYVIGSSPHKQGNYLDIIETIRLVRPNYLVLELCENRLLSLGLDDNDSDYEEGRNNPSNSIASHIKEYGLIETIRNLVWVTLSIRCNRYLYNSISREEFKTAIREARSIPGCLIQLGDRSNEITLLRAMRTLYLWEKVSIAFRELINEILLRFTNEKKKKESLEDETRDEYNSLLRILFDERIVFLTYSLQLAAFPTIVDSQTGNLTPPTVVAIVSDYHIRQIIKNWRKVNHEDIPPILSVPEATLAMKILVTSIKLSAIALVTWTSCKYLVPKKLSNVILSVPMSLLRLLKR